LNEHIQTRKNANDRIEHIQTLNNADDRIEHIQTLKKLVIDFCPGATGISLRRTDFPLGSDFFLFSWDAVLPTPSFPFFPLSQRPSLNEARCAAGDDEDLELSFSFLARFLAGPWSVTEMFSC
jgi:hypothetical protein